MQKTLYINEIHRDYRIKDPDSFPKEHAKIFKQLQKANIQLENEIIPKERRVKVKSVTNKKLTPITKANLKDFEGATVGDWYFSCEVLVKIYE